MRDRSTFEIDKRTGKLLPNYRSFRIQLHIDFDGKILTKQLLRNLMNDLDYGQYTHGRLVNDNQVEFAWNELQKQYAMPEEVAEKRQEYIVVKSYYRMIKGKRYRIKSYRRKKHV